MIEMTGVYNRTNFPRGLKFYEYVSRFLELRGSFHGPDVLWGSR